MRCLEPLHSDNGWLLIDQLDQFMKFEKVVKKNWVGFVHNIPHHPPIISKLYGEFNDFDLEKLFSSLAWETSKETCRGIFCLSEDSAKYVRSIVDTPVSVVYHATATPDTKFSMNAFIENPKKRVATIGHWLRDFQATYDLKSPYKKVIFKLPSRVFRYYLLNQVIRTNDTVQFLDYMSNDAYDDFLSKNIVFLKLFGSSANNAVIECIVRNTPLLVNRLPAVEEYLGSDYPLFYETLEEATDLLCSESIIEEAVNYLCNSGVKEKVSCSNFVDSIKESEIFYPLKVL